MRQQFTAILLIALVGISIAQNANDSPAANVINKIDSLVQASRNEQAEQTRIYTSQHLRCVNEEAYRKKEIGDAEVAQGAANQQLQICRAELPIAQSAADQSQAELTQTLAQQTQLNVEHDVYQAANLARQQEHADAISNIQAAYNIIGSFANGKAALSNNAVFVQVTQKLNSVFKLAIKHNFHSSMIPVMSALVQLTASPAAAISTSQLVKVINLFKQLEANVKKSENNRASEWAAYEKQYQIQGVLLQSQVNSLTRIIKRYAVYLNSLHSCVRKEAQIYHLAHGKFVRNSKILKASIDMCHAYDVKFRVQTGERSDYVALLGQLRSFVVSAISEYNSGLYSKKDFVNEVQVNSN